MSNINRKSVVENTAISMGNGKPTVLNPSWVISFFSEQYERIVQFVKLNVKIFYKAKF